MREERDGVEELVKIGRLKGEWRRCLRIKSFLPWPNVTQQMSYFMVVKDCQQAGVCVLMCVYVSIIVALYV